MFLTETIELSYWLKALIHFHIYASVLALFSVLQFIFPKKGLDHQKRGFLFSVFVFQACISGFLSNLGLQYHYWSSGLEMTRTTYRVLLSGNFALASIYCLVMGLLLHKEKKWPKHAITLVTSYLAYAGISLVVVVKLNWFPHILYILLGMSVHTLCYFKARSWLKDESQLVRNKLHGLYNSCSFLYLFQGLILGASSKIIFPGAPAFQGILGWILIPTTHLLLICRVQYQLRSRPHPTSAPADLVHQAVSVRKY